MHENSLQFCSYWSGVFQERRAAHGILQPAPRHIQNHATTIDLFGADGNTEKERKHEIMKKKTDKRKRKGLMEERKIERRKDSGTGKE